LLEAGHLLGRGVVLLGAHRSLLRDQHACLLGAGAEPFGLAIGERREHQRDRGRQQQADAQDPDGASRSWTSVRSD